LADQYGTYTTEGTVINLSLTQTDLAEMTGATRVSINKALGRFRRAGWIRIVGRQVTVIDRAGLEGMTIVSASEV
jgi:CRP-like cAMP-binding protein